MAYDLRGGGGLRSGRRGRGIRDVGTGVDPMANVANIVDAMLVLSVGLMIAVIAYWNVDLPQLNEVIEQEELTKADDIKELTDDINSSGSSYTELGTVYQDPSTGQMYMLAQEQEGSAK